MGDRSGLTTQMELQEIGWDGTLAALFTAAAAVSLEIASVVLFDTDMSEILVSDPVTVTLASAVSVVALGTVWLINQPNVDRLDIEERLAVVATVAIILVGIFYPSVLDPVYNDNVLGIIALAIESGGFWTIATA